MRKLIAISLVILFAGVVSAFAGEKVTLTGYLIDNACSAEAKTVEKVKEHTVKCAQMPPCAKSGYALMTEDGKLYKLDEKGNKEVGKLLKSTKSEKGIHIKAEGEVDGDTLKVSKLSEETMMMEKKM